MDPYGLATQALRLLNPEDAHRLTIGALRAGLGPRSGALDEPALAVAVGGLALKNPVGLAAGFDKNAQVADAMLAAGFGFVECGTVTPRPQAGNDRPRLFRLPEDRGVINRMGFNNDGLEAFAGRLRDRRRKGIVGANIGANKDSSDRIADYVISLRRLWGLCDYFTLNISSPNTPGLRALQTKAALEELLGRVAEAREALATDRDFPVFLKVAPDLEEAEASAVVEVARRFGLQALIVGNTTISRPETLRSPRRNEAGGLSGAPLMPLATRILARFREAAEGQIDLIAAGGVTSGADAYAKIRAGAKAMQLYSALVFEGPGLVRRIRRDLALRLRAEGFASVSEAASAT